MSIYLCEPSPPPPPLQTTVQSLCLRQTLHRKPWTCCTSTNLTRCSGPCMRVHKCSMLRGTCILQHAHPAVLTRVALLLSLHLRPQTSVTYNPAHQSDQVTNTSLTTTHTHFICFSTIYLIFASAAARLSVFWKRARIIPRMSLAVRAFAFSPHQKAVICCRLACRTKATSSNLTQWAA